MKKPPLPARALRKVLQRVGMHPDDTETVDIGVGGSIPFVAAFAERNPDAAILLTGVGDPTSRAHGPNESLSLDDFRSGILGEAIALRNLRP